MLAMVLPFLGSVVGFGTGLIALLFTAVVGGGTIMVAWFAHRPMVSLMVGLVTAAVVAMTLRSIHQKKARAIEMSAAEVV